MDDEIPEDLDVTQWKREEQPRLVKDLIENPDNPRDISKDQFAHLKRSIKAFGLFDDILINFDGRIIAGHQRKRAITQLGWKKVHCKVPPRPITEKEFQEISIRHNLNVGKFDYDKLANHHDVVDLFDYGFTPNDLHLATDEIIDDEKPKKEKECPHCGGKL